MDRRAFSQAAQAWQKQHKSLLQKHKGQWIAYNGEDGIIAFGKAADKVIQEADLTGKKYIVKYLHPYTYAGLRRLLPVRFRPLRRELWEPNLMLPIRYKEKSIELEMLVDSGADISTISYQIGKELGFIPFEGEVSDLAAGVNGTVEYVIRQVEMEIEGFSFKAPVAWFLYEHCDDLLLGREIVFDLFDIEFKQAEQKIIFKKRASV